MKNKLTKEQIILLEKYKINYDVNSKKELLINIDDVMTDYLDKTDEPTDDFMIIEKLYDDIYRDLPPDITTEDEHDFISYFDKDVIIVLKNFKTLSGHCESFTRKEDTDYSNPELTINTKEGHIVVEYSDVIIIVSELDRVRTHDNRIGIVMGIYPYTTGMEVKFDDNDPETETIDIKDVEEVLNNNIEIKEDKNKLKLNDISKADFIKLKEDDVMFITNPGRMGDEDGITFIIKSDNLFKAYRVSGWMYGKRADGMITLDDAYKQLPKWHEAWEHGTDQEYKGKYIHLYMGFGNGLNIDNSIYDEFKPYLDIEVEKNLSKYNDKEKEEMQYAAIFNVWEKAFVKMARDKGYILK